MNSHELARQLLALPDAPVDLVGQFGKVNPLADVAPLESLAPERIQLRATQLRRTSGVTVIEHDQNGQSAVRPFHNSRL